MRGQASIFIIVGIVVVILASLFFVKMKYEPVTIGNNARLEKYMKDCLRSVVYDGLGEIGTQGMINPVTYLASDEFKIAYLYFKGKSYMPKLESFEEQLKGYVSENILSCDPELQNELGKPNVVVSLEDDVDVTLSYPDLEVNEIVKINFRDFYEQSSIIIDNTLKDPDWIYLDELASNGFSAKIIRVDKYTLIYLLKKEDFEYRFAVKY